MDVHTMYTTLYTTIYETRLGYLTRYWVRLPDGSYELADVETRYVEPEEVEEGRKERGERAREEARAVGVAV